MRASLFRLKPGEKETISWFTLFDGLSLVFSCWMLEPPWKNNARNVSCIHEGHYEVKPRNSKRHADHFEVVGVDYRTLILFHPGNYYWNTEGCIMPGMRIGDLNKDGEWDMIDSRKAMRKLLKYAPDGFELSVTS